MQKMDNFKSLYVFSTVLFTIFLGCQAFPASAKYDHVEIADRASEYFLRGIIFYFNILISGLVQSASISLFILVAFIYFQ